ncbi:hypothetical protein ELQ90_08365 [Labedella phragmitis]|uniref:ZIP family zinc transporter n=1 Tax=Labedella phragmitis TaxID=2498849 RepID=A0A444PSJ3_9MICO|nr:hypothetical protein [Labedella phragmitis]RWZ50843.1 hypothetical protein ELQ90_08365 [Labedella phragmitis]
MGSQIWGAAGAGLLAGGALVVGAVIAWFVRVPTPVVTAVMAFGCGVLISALAFDLNEEAEDLGGFLPTMAGFLAGAVVYVTAIAAGAILAMLCDTMIPEAFRDTKAFTGLLAVLGFFTSFAVHALA